MSIFCVCWNFRILVSSVFFEKEQNDFFAKSVFGEDIIERVVQLVVDLLDLELFPDDLIFDIVDPVIELGDIHLTIFGPGLGGLQSSHQGSDLILVLFFPLQGLLLTNLEKTRQVSSMFHSARPIITPVANIVFC